MTKFKLNLDKRQLERVAKQELNRRLSNLRCPVHAQPPELTQEGFQACCIDLVRLVEKEFGGKVQWKQGEELR